jgi:hypothetical protein
VPASPYMPDVKVEIGFGSGYSTPLASVTWTDVSAYVEASENISITFGRSDARTSADANSMTVTLDNRDGRFTALRDASPYYPNVKLGTPIRVSTTPVGGTASKRAVCFIDSWPVAWDGTDAYAKAAITATSRLARLGLNDTFSSTYQQTVLLDDPSVYYPLTADAADIGGSSLPTLLEGPMDFITPIAAPSFDGVSACPNASGSNDPDPAASFSEGGHFLSAGGGAYGSPLTYELWYVPAADMSPTTNEDAILFSLADESGARRVEFRCELPYGMRFQVDGTTENLSGAMVAGQGHYFALSIPPGGGVATICIDNFVTTSPSAFPDPSDYTYLSVGAGYSGTVSHLAMYDHALTGAQMLNHYTVGTAAYAGESITARFNRYATKWGGIPATEITTDAGSATVAAVNTDGQGTIDLIRALEATCGGVLYDRQDGVLTLLNRRHRYNPTVIELDMGSQQVGADFVPVLDRQSLVNDVTVTSVRGGFVHRIDSTSRGYYGPATLAIDTQTQVSTELGSRADWLLTAYSEPRTRAPSLSLNLLDFDIAPSQDDILTVTMGTLLEVANQPGQAANTIGRYFVEGYTETIGSASYTFTFNVSPAEPWTNVLILNDPVRGAISSGNVLAW